MPRAFYLLLGVQFVSTIADNAFLIIAIARVIELAGPAWLIPLLKVSFTISYVVLAPFVGPLADAFAKGRVMLVSNTLKATSAILLLIGLDPALCIGLAGLGAAIYAPAKYGLMTELVSPSELVKANGYFEGVTVTAVLLGTALGGFLVSGWMPLLHLGRLEVFGQVIEVCKSHLALGMIGVLALTLVATIMSAVISDHGVRHNIASIHPGALVRSFILANQTLWRDAVGGLSLGVTTSLWGVAATLQLLVLRWAHDVLGLPLSQAAYMQGVTAIGVICGAVLASRWVGLQQALRLLPLGVLLGAMLLLMLVVHSVFAAAALMIVVGALAGFFVVPMNALLQHRGCELLTAGRSIAVQGFNENASILAMVMIYTLATALVLPFEVMIIGFAVVVMASMAVFNLVAMRRRLS